MRRKLKDLPPVRRTDGYLFKHACRHAHLNKYQHRTLQRCKGCQPARRTIRSSVRDERYGKVVPGRRLAVALMSDPLRVAASDRSDAGGSEPVGLGASIQSRSVGSDSEP